LDAAKGGATALLEKGIPFGAIEQTVQGYMVERLERYLEHTTAAEKLRSLRD
jgi:hypothetical protein